MKISAVLVLAALVFVLREGARAETPAPGLPSEVPAAAGQIPSVPPANGPEVPPILDDSREPRVAPPPAAPDKNSDTPGMLDKFPAPLPRNEQKPIAKPALPAVSAVPLTLRESVDALAEGELDQVISLLKENYISPEALSEIELKRAGVQGVIDRLGPGAAILQESAGRAHAAGEFRAEILEDRIGYVRLGSPTAETVRELDAALQKFADKKLGAVVLDLRATPPSSDFEQTAEVCRRFCPKGKVLFSVKKPNIKQEQILTSKEEPKFRGIVVALVDRDTAGNAEVIAAVLRTHVNAMVIGQQTKGEAVEFAELPLQGGRLLRVAVAEVALPENVAVFPGGVKPDIAVDVPQETTDLLLKEQLGKGVLEFVVETERPRMNEAALVAGANPELDAMQLAQKNKGEKPKPPLRDAVLQRAMDFVTTVSVYAKKPTGK